ncbi:MAG: DUF4335 domain-containing protein [Leptolyngbya sp. SIOISBB]|nr:DUF4335 domain-containing protein [Leptolyngbya sp. SIOISBB]
MTSTAPLTPLRYDSPTVTLEVMAREAAVSQWSDKPVVQVLRYHLQIRDLSDAAAVIEIRGDRASFIPLMASVQHYVQAQLTGETGVDAPTINAPYLAPDSLTQHTWHLGKTQTSAGETRVRLGAVQLADLEAVLDQLNDAVRPLPVPLMSAPQRRSWRQWGTAAAGLVAAVGITTALWPNYQSQQHLETAQEAPSVDAEIAPTPNPQNVPPRAESLDATAEADSADAGDTAITGEPLPAEALPSVEQGASPADPTVKNDAVTIAPSTDIAPSAPSQPERTAPKPDDAVTDQFSDTVAGDVASTPAAEPAPIVPAPSTRQTPGPVNAPPSPPRELSAPTPSPSAPAASTEAEAEATAEGIPEMLSAEETQRALPRPEPGSLADLVQQVRDRWMPPAELDQTLTYTLVLAADGTLVQVMPADALAAEYRDRTGIPVVGTEWLPSGAPQRILLLLKPNGDVEFQDVGFN